MLARKWGSWISGGPVHLIMLHILAIRPARQSGLQFEHPVYTWLWVEGLNRTKPSHCWTIFLHVALGKKKRKASATRVTSTYLTERWPLARVCAYPCSSFGCRVVYSKVKWRQGIHASIPNHASKPFQHPALLYFTLPSLPQPKEEQLN